VYDPKIHFNFDENKRNLWKNHFQDGQTMLSGFMFWEMAKVIYMFNATDSH